MIPVGIRCVLDMVCFGIQTYFGALFLDIVFQCVFGHSWTNLHNSLPESSGTTTRFVSFLFSPGVNAYSPSDGSILLVLVFPVRFHLLPSRSTEMAHHLESIYHSLRMSRSLHLVTCPIRRSRFLQGHCRSRLNCIKSYRSARVGYCGCYQ
jgi:hypothetical protein